MAPTRLPLLLLILLPSAAAVAAEPVLDTSGNPLKAASAAAYFIVPANRNTGGGLVMGARNASRCPFYVVQDEKDDSKGMPWWIWPADSNAKTVELGADANFELPASSLCISSPVWSLRQVAAGNNNLYMRASGGIGNPGAATLNRWFNIQRSESGHYKLVFCPKVCSECRPQCGDLGIFVEEGNRWLGLGGSPFPVMFKK